MWGSARSRRCESVFCPFAGPHAEKKSQKPFLGTSFGFFWPPITLKNPCLFVFCFFFFSGGRTRVQLYQSFGRASVVVRVRVRDGVSQSSIHVRKHKCSRCACAHGIDKERYYIRALFTDVKKVILKKEKESSRYSFVPSPESGIPRRALPVGVEAPLDVGSLERVRPRRRVVAHFISFGP